MPFFEVRLILVLIESLGGGEGFAVGDEREESVVVGLFAQRLLIVLDFEDEARNLFATIASVCPEKGILRSALVACASAIVLTRVESGGSVRGPRRECRFRMRSARTAPWVTRPESEMDDVMVMSGGERASFRARGLAARRFFAISSLPST